MAAKKAYAVIAIVIVAVAATGFYFFILPPPYRVAEREGTIGRSGGCVYDGGANVTIPEGALDADTLITVRTLNQTDLPAPTPPLTHFLGAAGFGPDGLTFKTDVAITIPLRESRTPGTVLPLFVYDAEKEEFVEADTSATVNPDGWTASASVTHFSIEALLDGVTPEATSGCYEEALDGGYTPQEAFNSVVDYVLSWAEMGKCDLESRLEFPKLVGVLVSLMWETEEGGDTYAESFGETSGACASYIVAAESSECSYVSDGKEWHMTYSLVVEVFIEYVQPKIDIPQDVIVLKPSDTATITAYLECCGETPVPDRGVEFHLSPLFGSISPASDTTDGNGVAETTYTAPDEEGTATLTVMYTFQTYEKTGTEVCHVAGFDFLKQNYAEKTTTIGDSVTIVVGEEYKVHIDQTVPWGPISGPDWTIWGTFRLILDASSEGGLYGNWTATSSLYMVTEGVGPAGTSHRETWIWEDFPHYFSLPEGGGPFEIWQPILEGYFDLSNNAIKVMCIPPEVLGIPGTFIFEGEIVPLEDC